MTVYCNNCSAQVEENSVFCGSCGAQMGIPAKKAIQESQPSVPYQAPLANSPGISTPPRQAVPQLALLPPERNYFKWVFMTIGLIIGGIILVIYGLISFFFNEFGTSTLGLGVLLLMSGGIAQMVYVYYNFDDYRKLHLITHGAQMGGGIEPIVGVLLYLFISPAGQFMKYNQLHEHLKRMHEGETENPPNPILVLLVVFTPAIISFVPFFTLFGSFELLNASFAIIGILILSIPFIILFFEYRWQKAMNAHIRNHAKYLTS